MDKLGLHHGHLPSTVPFTIALDDITPPTSPDSENEKKIFTITNYELQKAISSIGDFDLLYLVNYFDDFSYYYHKHKYIVCKCVCVYICCEWESNHVNFRDFEHEILIV